MKCYPMLVVNDVEVSSAWYRRLLGLTSGHGGREFEMLMAGDQLAMLLHHLDFAEHPAIDPPGSGNAGRGVLLYFSVSDVAEHFARAREMDADLVGAPHENPKAGAIEFSVRDPDGYALTISQWTGAFGSGDA